MKDLFTYINRSGKKQLTPLAWSVVFIVLALLGTMGLGAYTAHPTRAVVQGTSIPLTSATTTPIPPTVAATAVTVSLCETDSTKWSFVNVLPDEPVDQFGNGPKENNFKKIEPTCVYDGLSETIAYHLLHLEGYSQEEAAVKTGLFARIQGLPTIKHWDPKLVKFAVRPAYNSDSGGRATLVNPYWLYSTPYWLVNNGEKVLPTMNLLGCYRTYDVVGNERVYIVPDWKGSVDVVCQVSEDVEVETVVMTDQDRDLVISYPDVSDEWSREFGRTTIYFGYSDRTQVWYEFTRDKVPTSLPPEKERLSEYSFSEKIFGVSVWDEAWLNEKYNPEQIPFPDGWETMNTQEEFDAFFEKIKQ